MHPVLDGIVKHARFASAYIFSGPPFSGKEVDAEEFIRQLGCAKVDQLWIKPDGASIKIDQIRSLQKFVRYGPAASSHQVVVIEKTEELTDEAGGAFLKTLEEPQAGVIFILLVEREDKLLKTIVSRCQKIVFCEKDAAWQANPENIRYYQALRGIGRSSFKDMFSLSLELEKEKSRLEAILYDLAFFAFCEMKISRVASSLLEAAKNIKKRANVRLSLDVALMKMREICQNN